MSDSQPARPTRSRWPDFIVVGSPRSGTTSLFNALRGVDGICMSRVKEPRFFHRAVDLSDQVSGLVATEADYLGLWAGCRQADILGEATPTYFHDEGTPEAIHARIPNVRLALLARNPVDRAISHFHFKERRTGRSEISLAAAIQEARHADPYDPRWGYLLTPGFYGRHLKRWMEFFEAERLHIATYEGFVRNPTGELARFLEFLGVPRPGRDIPVPAMNVSSVPRGRASAWIMQSGGLRSLVGTLGLGRRASELGKRILLTPKTYPEPGQEVRELLWSLFDEDVSVFEALSGLDTGWAARGQG